MKVLLGLSISVLLILSPPAGADDEPGPLASADKKLDYLITSWEGRTLKELRSVWGRESDLRERSSSRALYVFEQTVGGRASVNALGQFRIPTNRVTCRASFEVENGVSIVAATRRGNAKTCWGVFKRNAPP